ncbi:MAG: rhomboid family intramembrane serine protease [Verrucomicrobiota bacterium]
MGRNILKLTAESSGKPIQSLLSTTLPPEELSVIVMVFDFEKKYLFEQPAMIYDRPYMRGTSGPEMKQTSVVTTLLIVTIAVFVLQQVLNVMFPGYGGSENRFMAEWFALSGQNFKELKVWTILTYSFLHSTAGFFHILGNMLMLFLFGRIIEPMIGKDRFLYFYLGAALVGGLFYLLFNYNSIGAVVGASGSIAGLLALFCLLRWNQPTTFLLFLVLPVTFKPKWLFWVATGITVYGLLFTELAGKFSPNGINVAHSAHLGGLLGGVLYYRFAYKGASFGFTKREKPTIEMPEWFKKTNKSEGKFSYRVNRTNRESLQNEVDRILDKINLSGFGSLTEDEKATLDQAKDILSK